jgi:single-stranded DNA-binding protein
MTDANVSFAGNLTDDPEIRYTESGIARGWCRIKKRSPCCSPTRRRDQLPARPLRLAP